MSTATVSHKREQTRGEEIANSLSHGIGLVLALIACPFLLIRAGQSESTDFLVGALIFSLSTLILYFSSALYHALPKGRSKQVLRMIEHSAIFVLIAGTYTPFTLGVLKGSWGWTLCALVWTLALVGVVLKSSNRLFHPRLSNVMFLLMGWLILVAIKPMLDRVPMEGLLLLLAGGIAYSLGVGFYAVSSRVRYAHFVWHLFVMAGTTLHYFSVYWYAA